jgi:signal transduction histidine kinase
MSGGASLVRMARDQKDWDMASQSLEILNHSVSRISSLVIDMLDYSKEREPEIDPVDLRALTAEIVEVTLMQAQAQDAQVFVSIEEGAGTVQADEARLFRCLLNLVQNALDVSPPGGVVSIRVERVPSEAARKRLKQPAESVIIIRVADEGPGIPEATYEHLFEPFFSTKGSKGTGLGLAVSRKIIREHGGELELISGPREPTEFAMYLPG